MSDKYQLTLKIFLRVHCTSALPAGIQQVESICNNLHNSVAWKRASWRRKIKLASKEFNRQSLKHPTISTEALKHGLLYPLRIISEHPFSTPTDYILGFDISNRLGSSLSRLSRNHGKYLVMEDFQYAAVNYVPLQKIPFSTYQQRIGRYDFWDFWKTMRHLMK